MVDPIRRILGDSSYNKACFGCGTFKNTKRRFTGGSEGILCDKCWEDAKVAAEEMGHAGEW